MSDVIGCMGESGSGKTTAMRNLPPEQTFYLDCDKKGLNWKGWRKAYNTENKNYVATDAFSAALSLMDRIDKEKQFQHIKYLVIDTLNGLMVAEEMRILAMQGGDKRGSDPLYRKGNRKVRFLPAAQSAASAARRGIAYIPARPRSPGRRRPRGASDCQAEIQHAPRCPDRS